MIETFKDAGRIFVEEAKKLVLNETFWVIILLLAVVMVGFKKLMDGERGRSTVFLALEQLIDTLAEAVTDAIEAVKCAVSFKDGVRMLFFGHFSESAQFVMLNYTIVFLSIVSFGLTVGGLNNIWEDASAICISFGLQTAFLLFSSRLTGYFFIKSEGLKKEIYYCSNLAVKIFEDSADEDSKKNQVKRLPLPQRLKKVPERLWRKKGQLAKNIVIGLLDIWVALVIIFFTTMYLLETMYEKESEADKVSSVLSFIVEDSREYNYELKSCYENTKLNLIDFLSRLDECVEGEKSEYNSGFTMEERIDMLLNELNEGVVNENTKDIVYGLIKEIQKSQYLSEYFSGDEIAEASEMFDTYIILHDYLNFDLLEIEVSYQNMYQEIVDKKKRDVNEKEEKYVGNALEYLNEYMDSLNRINYKVRYIEREDTDFGLHYSRCMYWQEVLTNGIEPGERARRDMIDWNKGRLWKPLLNLFDNPDTNDLLVGGSLLMAAIPTGFIAILCIFRGRLTASAKATRKRSTVIAAFLKEEKERKQHTEAENMIVVIVLVVCVCVIFYQWKQYMDDTEAALALNMVTVVIAVAVIEITYMIGGLFRKQKGSSKEEHKADEKTEKNNVQMETTQAGENKNNNEQIAAMEQFPKLLDNGEIDETYIRKNVVPQAIKLLETAEILPLMKNVMAFQKPDLYEECRLHQIESKKRHRENHRYMEQPFLPKHRVKQVLLEESFKSDVIMVRKEEVHTQHMQAEFLFLAKQGLIFPVYDGDYELEGYVLGDEFMDLLFDCVISKELEKQSIERTFEEEMMLYEEPKED